MSARMTMPIRLLSGLAIAFALHAPVLAQSSRTQVVRGTPQPDNSGLIKDKLNAWTVGLAGGLLEGAPIRFATEIARVVDDGENLHVLPIVTRGPSENVEALLYLRGIDAAIINSDALEEFKKIVPEIQQKISFILSLFSSEVHVFARPEIKSIHDLAGKRVNFNTAGTAAAYSGPLIFERLQVDIDKLFIPHQQALEQLRKGEIAALVFVTSKPVEAFTKRGWAEGFKFLPIEYNAQFEDLYLPSSLSASDYPDLIGPGSHVSTIAVPTILAAFNWPKNSDRYRRIARLVDRLFSRIEMLHEPGFHPKWKEINLGASVPGLNRSPAAQDWLETAAARVNNVASKPETQIDPKVLRAQIRKVAPDNQAEQRRLFREFMEWELGRRRGQWSSR